MDAPTRRSQPNQAPSLGAARRPGDNAPVPTHIVETVQLTVSADEVLRRLAQAGFVRRRTAVNPSLPGRLVRHDVTDELVVAEVQADVPDRWLPDRVLRVMTIRPSVRRVETWHRDEQRGAAAYEFTGVPARATGTMILDDGPDGASCRLTQTVQLSVSLPVVGRLVEQAVAGHIARGLRAEGVFYGEPQPGAEAAEDVGEGSS